MFFDPDRFYDEFELDEMNLKEATLATGRKSGKLRHSRIGTRFLYRGSWLIDWIVGESKGGQPI